MRHMPLNSAPAAAPVLAAAAPLVPKKNPPAIMCTESKEAYDVCAISGKKWKRNIANEAYEAARISRYLQQRQCLQLQAVFPT